MDTFILSAARTPIGKFLGELSDLPAPKLGALAIAEAVMRAAQAIKAGDANVVVAGGMESMSNAPFLLQGVRKGYKYGDQKTVDALVHDGLWCAFENWAMGEAAEYIAGKCEVSRADQDRFAAQSHKRAAAAWERGDFAAEVVPVTVGS